MSRWNTLRVTGNKSKVMKCTKKDECCIIDRRRGGKFEIFTIQDYSR